MKRTACTQGAARDTQKYVFRVCIFFWDDFKAIKKLKIIEIIEIYGNMLRFMENLWKYVTFYANIEKSHFTYCVQKCYERTGRLKFPSSRPLPGYFGSMLVRWIKIFYPEYFWQFGTTSEIWNQIEKQN